LRVPAGAIRAVAHLAGASSARRCQIIVMAEAPMISRLQVIGPQRRRRPRAVTFVASLLTVEGFLALLVAGLAAAAWSIAPDTMRAADVRLSVEIAVLLGSCGGSMLVGAVGLFLVRPWAWTLAMSTQCLTLTSTLYGYLSGDPDYPVMALAMLAVLLLNRQEVRLAFAPPERRRD